MSYRYQYGGLYGLQRAQSALQGQAARSVWQADICEAQRRIEQMHAVARGEPVPPSLEGLTRALWETDPEVVKWVGARAEWHDGLVERSVARGTSLAAEAEASEVRRDRARAIAWERREPAGSRERAEVRARAVLDALGRSGP